MHCHGVGRFDFTELSNIDLFEIEAILAARKHKAVLTLYLPESEYAHFFQILDQFHTGRQSNLFPHIMGFGLEGPLLASHGGTPHKGVWNPSKRQWKQLAGCGKQGLIYMIFSPDAELNVDENSNIDNPAPSVTWIAETLLDSGVLPAAGHFTKANPVASAKALQSIYDVVAAWGQGATITDHIYNDMPHNFKHAWRTRKERERRDIELQRLDLNSWSLDNLDEQLGLVPATMIKNARKGLVKVAQNFDGEHVDLAVIKKTVELLGAENMLMMTDSIESRKLAGRELRKLDDSTLLYQDEGIVAAGSQGVDRQIENMLKIGLTDQQINTITKTTPEQVLTKREEYVREKNQTMCV